MSAVETVFVALRSGYRTVVQRAQMAGDVAGEIWVASVDYAAPVVGRDPISVLRHLFDKSGLPGPSRLWNNQPHENGMTVFERVVAIFEALEALKEDLPADATVIQFEVNEDSIECYLGFGPGGVDNLRLAVALPHAIVGEGIKNVVKASLAWFLLPKSERG